ACGRFSVCDPRVIQRAKSEGIQIHCCSEDYCNDAMPSDGPQRTHGPTRTRHGQSNNGSGSGTFTPLIPLLIAVVANAIAVLAT
ncbi:hypothetical protein AAVH_31168, partial [Aphelenchoides avenae]